jgi:hypothetical protein
MNKQEYAKALRRKEWRNKRKEILKRDNYACTKCKDTKELHVHHTYYLEGKMPWEVPNDCLITLCKSCHKKEHEGKSIQSFVRKADKKEPKRKVKKQPEKIKKMRFYKFMAVKSPEFKEVFDKSVNWREVKKPKGSISKGFDDRKLAEKWLLTTEKPKNKKPAKVDNLSKKDRELQKKYDEIKRKNKLPESNYKPLTFVKKKIKKK